MTWKAESFWQKKSPGVTNELHVRQNSIFRIHSRYSYHEHNAASDLRIGIRFMYATFITDFVTVIVLMVALYLLWKERSHFYSLRPFLPAVVFLIISHVIDMLIEHPTFRLSESFHLPAGYLEILLGTLGNIADTLSFSLLIYGFINVVKFKKAEEKRIDELERLLPLCSNCKKYQTEAGEWLPIERYLAVSGAPKITHGICPECAEKLYGDILKKNKS